MNVGGMEDTTRVLRSQHQKTNRDTPVRCGRFCEVSIQQEQSPLLSKKNRVVQQEQQSPLPFQGRPTVTPVTVRGKQQQGYSNNIVPSSQQVRTGKSASQQRMKPAGQNEADCHVTASKSEDRRSSEQGLAMATEIMSKLTRLILKSLHPNHYKITLINKVNNDVE
ncbi:hypothetical protein BaRGS_00039227 [Batillaria attramentaria]|uniref:Uncharacterized protein n=1 Tax=Batillaria attramentaria TaxID=370345 RepID=A0ABD0J4D9_9CAEN